MQTPLFEACALKNSDVAMQLVRYFINIGVDPKCLDSLQQLPLFYAVREGHQAVVKVLLEQGTAVNHVDTYG